MMQGVSRFLMLCLTAALLLPAAEAFAQQDDGNNPPAPEPVKDEPVEAKYTGVSGGVLLGAEVVLAIECLIDPEDLWPYIVFPIVGGAAGGVGGWFAEQAEPKAGVAMLVIGMAAIIPTAVAVSVARSYSAEDEGAVDQGERTKYSFEAEPVLGPASEEATTEVESRPDGVPAGAPPPEAAPAEPPPPETAPPQTPGGPTRPASNKTMFRSRAGALVRFESDGIPTLGVPAFAISTGPATAESVVLGNRPGHEIHVPLIQVRLP